MEGQYWGPQVTRSRAPSTESIMAEQVALSQMQALGLRCWSVPWEVGLGQFQVSVGIQLSLTCPTGLDGQALAPRAQRGRGLRGLGTQ